MELSILLILYDNFFSCLEKGKKGKKEGKKERKEERKKSKQTKN